MNIFNKINQLYDKFKLKFFIKRSIINTRLNPWEWYDTDTRMLYGMMNLLNEYVENERCFETIEWNDNPIHKAVKDEIVAIRYWWSLYKIRQDAIGAQLHDWHTAKFGPDVDENFSWLDKLNKPDSTDVKRLFDDLHNMEQKLVDEEEEMLIRLIKIRKFLWT